MTTQDIKLNIQRIVTGLYDEYPYKKVGDFYSYSDYRQGINDGIDMVEQKIIEYLDSFHNYPYTQITPK